MRAVLKCHANDNENLSLIEHRENEVIVLNRCFDDISCFIDRLKYAFSDNRQRRK